MEDTILLITGLLNDAFVDKLIESYKNITPCLLLYFDTEPKVRPIREHRFKEYEYILSNKDTRV